MDILVIARSINPRLNYQAMTKGDDQNAHVIICLSHLLNPLFQRFVRNAKNVYYCVEKENGTIKMTLR